MTDELGLQRPLLWDSAPRVSLLFNLLLAVVKNETKHFVYEINYMRQTLGKDE